MILQGNLLFPTSFIIPVSTTGWENHVSGLNTICVMYIAVEVFSYIESFLRLRVGRGNIELKTKSDGHDVSQI